MKTLRIVFLAVLVLALFTVGMASAGKFSYTTGFQVQNLSSSSASVAITYYNQDGSVAYTANDTIDGSKSKTYFPLPDGVGTTFNGSVVVSSDQSVGAVVNLLSTTYNQGASYVGSSSGGTSVQLPLLMKGNSGFDTWFNVQNTGSATASVSVTYSDGTTASASIPAGAAATFDQSTETHSETVFSAVVTSDQPVVAAAIQENASTLFAYSGFSAGSTNPVMPLINANNAGFQTGIQIQNVGTASTDVTVSYTPSSDGVACTETQTIAAGKSATFALYAFAGATQPGMTTTCAGGDKFIGAATVTTNSASQPLAAIVNQLGATQGESYNGFDPSTAGSTLVMPLLMDRNGGYFTGFNLMNVGTSAQVDCTFTDSTYTFSKTIDANKVETSLQNGQIADGYVGSAVCTAASGGKLLAVVNELGASADQFLVYEGISQ